MMGLVLMRRENGSLWWAVLLLADIGGVPRFTTDAQCPSPQPSYALALALDTKNLDMIQAWDEDSP